ncbi:DUF4194 domain-containing protein [Gordonibacter massiliensis (ex Traore et al. 2017)]|uniref:DUF4194 domain-containing protein n=1 Tax=Gordonibacter massiliensis (ex Traore et al. 2017) TaxID=1841863 RepID=UPI001C8B325B|nr:DUF4194 domain-containing protein [Gordonibacter massiliensis (ex Traore et al. 2017)]MBX9034087.1 DUF4194 domain-containing protein [Gordonibacter massiliensis (ex Traore et al. 2017)]
MDNVLTANDQTAASEAPEHKPFLEGLFEGDTGTLDYEQRRAVTTLVRKRYVSEVTDAEIWNDILEHEDVIRSSLNNLFLTLTVDKRYDVAYAQQAPSGSANPFPNALKQSASLKREETLLIIYLRIYYHQQFASGETNVFVDREDLENYLDPLFNKDAVDHVAAKDRVAKAIDEMTSKQGYLIKVAGQSGRYRISPVVASLFPLERVKELKEKFEAEAPESPRATDGEAQDE